MNVRKQNCMVILPPTLLENQPSSSLNFKKETPIIIKSNAHQLEKDSADLVLLFLIAKFLWNLQNTLNAILIL
jgi:hypothetical protein